MTWMVLTPVLTVMIQMRISILMQLKFLEMVSMKIASNIELFVNWGAASALGVVLLAITLLILWAAGRLLRIEQMTGGGRT